MFSNDVAQNDKGKKSLVACQSRVEYMHRCIAGPNLVFDPESRFGFFPEPLRARGQTRGPGRMAETPKPRIARATIGKSFQNDYFERTSTQTRVDVENRTRGLVERRDGLSWFRRLVLKSAVDVTRTFSPDDHFTYVKAF